MGVFAAWLLRKDLAKKSTGNAMEIEDCGDQEIDLHSLTLES